MAATPLSCLSGHRLGRPFEITAINCDFLHLTPDGHPGRGV
jgi:hypothetical protein